jgi:hypothetical protein
MPNLAIAPAGCGPAIISAAQSTAAAHARRGCRQDVHILVQQRQQQGEAGAEVVLVPHSRFSTTSTPYCIAQSSVNYHYCLFVSLYAGSLSKPMPIYCSSCLLINLLVINVFM